MISSSFFISSLDLALELREDGFATEGDASGSEELPLEDLFLEEDDLSLEEDDLSLEEDDLSLAEDFSFDDDLSFEVDL